MLVLSRKPDEAIYIETPAGEVIRLVLIDIRGDKIRLGLEAPPSHKILRGELYARSGEQPPAAA